MVRESVAPLTGEVSATDYLGWGGMHGTFDCSWRPSAGYAPAATIDTVVRLAALLAGESAQWSLRPFPDIVAMHPYLQNNGRIDLPGFAALWKNCGFPGRLDSDSTVTLDAPQYFDSVIVSGPVNIVVEAQRLGLEARAVLKDMRLPVFDW